MSRSMHNAGWLPQPSLAEPGRHCLHRMRTCQHHCTLVVPLVGVRVVFAVKWLP